MQEAEAAGKKAAKEAGAGDAVKAADDAMDENDYARQDWGDPGKNHKTVNEWAD